MRCFTLFFLIFSLAVLVDNPVFSQEKTSITKVVIDAGHGGKDPGTIGKKSQEKNIALQIALKLADEIRSQCKGVTVICTRTTDEFIELHERAEIANRSKADLFISIHCNANPKHTFQGAETYIMGLHRTEANLEIAKKENAAILMEPDYSTNYNGFDPNSDESYITFTLFQNAFLEQSTWFASMVQDEMKDRVGMYDRGVRQAGFLVLYKTTMPSVLVETGFLSNPDEEKFLMSQKGQQYISSAICRAFRKFKAKMEGNGKELASLNDPKSVMHKDVFTPSTETKGSNTSVRLPNEPYRETDTVRTMVKSKQQLPEPDTDKNKGKPKGNTSPKTTEKSKGNTAEKSKENDPDRVVIKSKTSASPKDTLGPKENPKENPKEYPKGNQKGSHKGKPGSQVKKRPASKTPLKDTVQVKAKDNVQPVHKDSGVQGKDLASNTSKSNSVKDKPAIKSESVADPKPGKPAAVGDKKMAEPVKSPANAVDEVVFRIQIATSPKELSVHAKKFEGLPDVWKYEHQGSFKYTAGKGSTPEALSGLMSKVKNLGFKDAFIVAFHGTERITVAEAKKIISEQR